MKIEICACIVAMGLLGGCASMRDRPMSQVRPSSQQQTIDVDYAYVARIDQQAQQRNVGIQWVNPPSKRPMDNGH